METRSLLLPDEEDAIREELLQAKKEIPDENENFQANHDGFDLGQRALSSDGSDESESESVHFDDDEDRIPEELLLKYTDPGEMIITT